MFAQRLANAASRAVVRTRAPAAKRSMGIANNNKVESDWNESWNKVDVYPIVFMVTLASTFSIYTIGKNASAHEDVMWNKKNKAMSVAQFYAHRYPGTSNDEGNKPGPHYPH
mmetsp:Transcript_26522/g.41542  ORF Transcript_26522/g.41542 Transcript_26522/m.41542 type:complete len:112 (-) Transcript_26522:241-576(-)